MNCKMAVYGIGIALICIILLAGALAEPKKQILTYVSGFGFLALIFLIFLISIPSIERIWKSPIAKGALANRRHIGILSFIFALMHVLLVFHFFFAWDANKVLASPTSLFLSMGAAAFLMLALMMAVSNDFSMKALGRSWKYLQYLIYPALLLVLIHFISVGKIFAQNTAIVAAALILTAAAVVLKFWLKQKQGS